MDLAIQSVVTLTYLLWNISSTYADEIKSQFAQQVFFIHTSVIWSACNSLKFISELPPPPFISTWPPDSDSWVILCNSSSAVIGCAASSAFRLTSFGFDLGCRIATAASGIETGGGWGGIHLRWVGPMFIVLVVPFDPEPKFWLSPFSISVILVFFCCHQGVELLLLYW